MADGNGDADEIAKGELSKSDEEDGTGPIADEDDDEDGLKDEDVTRTGPETR